MPRTTLTLTVTIDTDYPAMAAKNAVLDALYDAHYARGGDYIRVKAERRGWEFEELEAKIEANNAKREFLWAAHQTLCSTDLVVESKADPDDPEG